MPWCWKRNAKTESTSSSGTEAEISPEGTAATCRNFLAARSNYYLHQSQNSAKYQMVKEQIITIFNENKKRYGYRRITKELHNNDICVNHKTVRKLMKQLGLVCQVRAKGSTSSYKGEVEK